MAIALKTQWEIRTDGNDDNGGGFVEDASGTDHTQQAAAHSTRTDLVIGSAGSEDELSSAADNFAADDIGNLIHVTAGTNFTTGFYQVLSVASGVATVDRNVGTADATSGTGQLGGACLTFDNFNTDGSVDAMIGGNTLWVKKGTYTITARILFAFSASSNDNTRCIGYETTRGDRGRPTIDTTGTFDNLVLLNTAGFKLHNFIMDGSGGTINRILQFNGPAQMAMNCKTIGGGANSQPAVKISGSTAVLVECEVADSANRGIDASNDVYIYGCSVHDGGEHGIVLALTTFFVVNCIFYGNTDDGIVLSDHRGNVMGNTCYDNGSDGISIATSGSQATVYNNLCVNNMGYGINLIDATDPNEDFSNMFEYNAFRNNTSGARNNYDKSPNDVDLTADPFTDAASGDFSLNNDAGGGKLCKGTGYPGAFPGASSTGFMDIGAVQEEAKGGAANWW